MLLSEREIRNPLTAIHQDLMMNISTSSGRNIPALVLVLSYLILSFTAMKASYFSHVKELHQQQGFKNSFWWWGGLWFFQELPQKYDSEEKDSLLLSNNSSWSISISIGWWEGSLMILHMQLGALQERNPELGSPNPFMMGSSMTDLAPEGWRHYFYSNEP